MKIVSALLGIALVLVGAAAIHFWREADAGRQQIAGLQAQLQQHRATSLDAAPAPAVQPATPAAVAAGKAEPATGPVPPSADLAEADAATRSRLQVVTGGTIGSSPEALARHREVTRMVMATTNPGVGEALGLSHEEEERLLDLLAANQERTSAAHGFGAAGSSSPVQDRAATVRELQQAHEAELQAMLGSKYAQWQDYTQSRAAWQQRRDLRAVLNAAGTPLTDAQDKSLIAALSAEHRSIHQEVRDAAERGQSAADLVLLRYSPERRQRMLDAAAPHLSPSQLESYRGMLERAAAQ